MSRRTLVAVAFAASTAAAGAAASPATAQTGRVEGTVDTERGPAVGAIVFLVPPGSRSYATPEAPAVIDQVELRFLPQVVTVLPGTTVAFPNSDPFLHNVFSPRGPGAGFDLGTYPPGETRARRFTELGIHVILCHVHPEMVAYVAVVPAPYNAITDADGRFSIERIPAGQYRLGAWYGRHRAEERDVWVSEDGVLRVLVRLER
jgi:plastocyanin